MREIKHYVLPEHTNRLYKNEAISSISLTKEVASKINELVDAYNELNKGNLAKIQEQDGKIRKGILYMKDNLINTLNDLLENMKASGEIDELVKDVIEGIGKKLNDVIYINKSFGSLDDTYIIQKALSDRRDNSSYIVLEKNTYLAKGTIDLYSNTHINLNGSTIKSCETKYNATTRDSGGLRFLNSALNMVSGVENIVIENGTFEGEKTGILFGLLHGKNIRVENVNFKNCSIGTHIFDLCGCQNVEFINCKFEGCSLEDDTNFREMIQTDYATYSSYPYRGENSSYKFDNESCDNIQVKGCTFSKGTGKTYPNAIGTHSVNEKYHSNIVIEDNTFIDCTNASIRFLRVHDLYVKNNTFINENNTSRSDKFFILLDNGRFDNVCKPDYNIYVTGNRLKTNINESNIALLYMYSDVNTGKYHKDIVIENNIINYKYTNIDSSVDFVRFGNVENVIISNNIINKAKNILFIRNNYNAKNITVVNNKFNDCRTLEQKFNTSLIEGVLYQGNTWLENGKYTVKSYQAFTELYSSMGITSGDIELSDDINNYEYLIVATGGVDNDTYMSMPIYPFNFRLGFRVDEDTLVIPTVNGKCVLSITNDNKLSIVSTNNKVRRVYGVKQI